MTKPTDLFNDFKPVSSKEWKQKIQADLKGLDYNDTLLTKLPDGLVIKPFYHSEFVKENDTFKSTSQRFKISEWIEVENDKKANSYSREVIDKKGVEAVFFEISNSSTNFTALLEKINPSVTEIHLILKILSTEIIEELLKIEDVYIHLDIIGNLARTGNWFKSLKEDHDLMERLVSEKNKFKSVLSIDISLYQNAGASHVQQIAYGLCHALEYLNHFEKDQPGSIQFISSTGGDYFLEIAKLRALRWVFNSFSEEFGLEDEILITSIPSKRNKTIYDYNTNLLRTTTECMSSILGGADFIANMAYDHIYHEPNEFAQRIGRNQLHIMRHEAYLDAVTNPVEGSYFIEELTQTLAQAALELIKNIERNGGFLSQLKEGTIQRKIKERASTEQEKFDSGELKLLGTNFQQNPTDKMKGELEKEPFLKYEVRKTLIEPILEKRLSENLDKERLNNEI